MKRHAHKTQKRTCSVTASSASLSSGCVAFCDPDEPEEKGPIKGEHHQGGLLGSLEATEREANKRAKLNDTYDYLLDPKAPPSRERSYFGGSGPWNN